jgi:anti-sigma factor RsiW
MESQHWTEKLDLYLDGELPPDEERALREHLRECPACAADALDRMQMKRAVHAAGVRFQPDAAFRARVQQRVSVRKTARAGWQWAVGLGAVAAVLLLAILPWTLQYREHVREQGLVGELVDQHVATLASANPVDVVSTDRHTVKPWFEGKVPFTFDLPELQGTPFVLVGGRVTYIHQAPGAELIFRLRQHQISVFIVQENATDGCAATPARADLSFHVRSWERDGLCYFAVGDVGADDLNQLAGLLNAPG